MAKTTKKKIALMLALSLCLGSLGACAQIGEGEEAPVPTVSETPDDEQNLYAVDDVFSLNCNREAGFNPLTSNNAANLICSQLMYDNLVEVDTSFKATPNLATSFESEDGINWQFKLDTSVKFWDGTTLTAQDAAYSVQRAMRSPQFKERLGIIAGVSPLGEDTLAIRLSRSNTQFPLLMNIPVIKNGTVDELVPLGTGPYIPNQERTEMKVFPEHRNGAKMPADTIYLKEFKDIEEIITAFENSEIDFITNDPNGFFNLGYGSSNEIRSYPTTNMHYLGFNSKSRFFSNPLCRRAMTYVVNREHITNDIMAGNATPAALPMNPASSLYNQAYSEIVSYSLKKSMAAFDEAEVQDYDDDGIREIMITGIPVESDFTFIVCSDSAAKVAAARSIAEGLTDLGIKVTLKELNWEAYNTALVAGEFDMFYAETKLTADFGLRNLFLKNGKLNYGKFADAVLEGYVEDYLGASQELRSQAADLMFKYITDTAPIVAICFEKQQVVTHRNVVTGLKPSAFNVFQNFDQWLINTKK